jgi:hypothetical protein
MQYEDIYFDLFIAITVYLGILTVHLIIKAIKAESERKFYYVGIAFFTGFYMICRIILEINIASEGDPYSFLYQIATFFAMLGLLGLMLAVEKYIYSRLKFIPSICIAIFTSLILILPTYNGTNLITYWATGGSLFAILIPLLYFHVGFKSTGEVRRKSLYMAVSLLVFIVGKGMNFVFLLELFPVLRIIVPILMIVGLILLHIGIA